MNFKVKETKIFFLFFLFNNFFSKENEKFVNRFVSSIFGLFTSGYMAIKGSSNQESKNLAYINVIQNIKEIVEIFSEKFFTKDENNEENKIIEEKNNRYFFKKNISNFERDSIKMISQLFNNPQFIKFLEEVFSEINLEYFESPEDIKNFFDRIIPKIVQLDREDI